MGISKAFEDETTVRAQVITKKELEESEITEVRNHK
jgi:hypothetical protein